MNPILTLSQVSKSYGSKPALQQVNLVVPRGCVFALLGENGAGKTTAIKCILGLETQSSGQINVLGMNPAKMGAKVRHTVGYVPDSPALYEWMTVAETGWFTSGFYAPGFLERYNAYCQQFELFSNDRVKNLSKGGRAKVSLALAMAQQPDLLIMDEPTSGLDTLVRRKFLESMVDVAASDRTVLLSSHQIPEVERVADQIAVVHQGRVLACDSLDNLKQKIERWVITFAGDDLTLPAFAGEIISHEGRLKRRQMLIISNPGPDSLWNLRDDPKIENVEVHTPSLEEIFVALVSTGHTINPTPLEIGQDTIVTSNKENRA